MIESNRQVRRSSILELYTPKIPGSEIDDRQCEWCQLNYTPRGIGQKYCSNDCRDEHERVELYTRGRFLILERDAFRCVYCGRSSFSDKEELHVDHIHPKIIGGAAIAGNLITACGQCNLEKHDMVLRNEDELIEEAHRRNQIAGIDDKMSIKL